MASQVLAEFDALYTRGWRGSVFIVDDNFIGNKGKLKKEILPAIIAWMEKRKHPFSLYTEVSINLADDAELMRLMVRAGFDQVFIGIESPNDESLAECSKLQNRNRDLIACVRKIQQAGLEVQAGFIVGFDKDPAMIFERLIEFIQESGIVTAMVGSLERAARHQALSSPEAGGEAREIHDRRQYGLLDQLHPEDEPEALLAGYNYDPENDLFTETLSTRG